MYGIYANIGGILMVNVAIYIYIAYMDPMGINIIISPTWEIMGNQPTRTGTSTRARHIESATSCAVFRR